MQCSAWNRAGQWQHQGNALARACTSLRDKALANSSSGISSKSPSSKASNQNLSAVSYEHTVAPHQLTALPSQYAIMMRDPGYMMFKVAASGLDPVPGTEDAGAGGLSPVDPVPGTEAAAALDASPVDSVPGREDTAARVFDAGLSLFELPLSREDAARGFSIAGSSSSELDSSSLFALEEIDLLEELCEEAEEALSLLRVLASVVTA